jgi:hypothetical protein
LAQDLTSKKRAAAINLVEAVTNLVRAIERANSVGAEIAQAGLTFDQTDFEEDDKIKHLTSAILLSALTSVDALDSWLTSQFHYTNLKQAMLRNFNS